MKQYYVYIITNVNHRVLYTGVTNNLVRRMKEHKEKIHPKSFTAKYNVNKLVYYDYTDDVSEAISWEKEVKLMKRADKITLIEEQNLFWEELRLFD